MSKRPFVLKVYQLPVMSPSNLINLRDALVEAARAHCGPAVPKDHIFVIFPADRIAVRDSERAYVEVMLHEWIVNDSARVRLTATIERAISNFTAQLPVSFRFVTGD